MKKIKLLTILGSISAFVAVAASSTANTSTKIINNQTLKTEIGNYEVVCFDFPKKVYVGELTTLDLNLITIDGSLILDLVWIVESAKPCLNVEAK